MWHLQKEKKILKQQNVTVPEINAINRFMVVNERLDAVDHTQWHFVYLIKYEERFFALAHITTDPVLKVQLRRKKYGILYM